MDDQLELRFDGKRDDFSRVHRLFRSRIEYLRKKDRIVLPEIIECILDNYDSENIADKFTYNSANLIKFGVNDEVVQSSNDRILKFLYIKYQDLKPTYGPLPDFDHGGVLFDNQDRIGCVSLID